LIDKFEEFCGKEACEEADKGQKTVNNDASVIVVYDAQDASVKAY